MVNKLENIKETEGKLLKIRLEIVEKEKEKEKKEKIVNAIAGVGGFFCGLSLLAWFFV